MNCQNELAHRIEPLHNPITHALRFDNIYICSMCQTIHVCEKNSDCLLIQTGEGNVCLYTGVVYPDVCSSYPQAIYAAPVPDPELDYLNIIQPILRFMYLFFKSNTEKYKLIIEKIMINDEFKQDVVSAIIKTFQKVFRCKKIIDRVSLFIIGRLFTQLIVGKYSNCTTYDANIIKVSKRKKEDSLLKQMRVVYDS